MSFTVPSMSGTREFLVALFKFFFSTRNADARTSYHGKRVTFLAGAITQLHAHIDSVQTDVMPDTASEGDPINRWGAIFGVVRKTATVARGANALRVYGTVASTATIGDLLTHQPSASEYKLGESLVIPASGYLDVDVESLSTGSVARLLVGSVLEFSAPPAGIKTRATIIRTLDEGGFDNEQFGAYRRRVLDTMSKPAAGGTQSDFIKWATEVTGVDLAYCYPQRAGIGTVDVVGLKTGTGSARHLSPTERATLLAYLKTKAPAHLSGSGGALRVLETLDDLQSVEIRITPNGQAAYAFDWDDVAGYTVSAYNAGTRELTFSGGALPATLAAKHRLIPKGVASSQDGSQFVVEAISGVDKVILQSSPTNALVATDVIYAGGPLVDPIRNAILAHMRGEYVYLSSGTPTGELSLSSVVGLEVLADPIGPANPAGVYGTWSGGLIRGVLGKIAISKSGVRNYSIPTPAVDYEASDPAYPLDSQIYLISPSSVIVRSA